MGKQREPAGILVNGAILSVKEPDGSGLFANYVEVPGIANFTLPNVEGTLNETALMDGVVSAAAYGGVGQITAPIGARTAHPAHQFLEAKKASGEAIQVTIRKYAVGVFELDDSISVAAAAARASVAAALQPRIKSQLRRGHMVGMGDAFDKAMAGFVNYDKSPAAGNNSMWRLVVDIEGDGSAFTFSPAHTAAIGTANAPEKLIVRMPGLKWEDILVTVNGFGSGDFQNANNVSGNLTLAPSVPLPPGAPEHTVEPE